MTPLEVPKPGFRDMPLFEAPEPPALARAAAFSRDGSCAPAARCSNSCFPAAIWNAVRRWACATPGTWAESVYRGQERGRSSRGDSAGKVSNNHFNSRK